MRYVTDKKERKSFIQKNIIYQINIGIKELIIEHLSDHSLSSYVLRRKPSENLDLRNKDAHFVIKMRY